MNDEQLRQPSDMQAEQDSSLNGNVSAGDGERDVDPGTVTGNMAAMDATESNGNDVPPEPVPASPGPDAEASASTEPMETANHAVDAGDITASPSPAQGFGYLRSEEPADVAASLDQPVFTDAIGAPTLTQPVTGLSERSDADMTAQQSLSPGVAGADAGGADAGGADAGGADAGGADAGGAELTNESPGTGVEELEPAADQEAEAPVVRTSRDSRLTEMAPNASMEDLLKASEQQYRTLKHGDVIEGTVMKVDRDEILVDIGSKSEGIIPSHELQSLSNDERETMKIGDELLVSVVQPENNEGHAVLSLDRARQEKSWRDLQKRFEAGEVIQAEVSGYNKGGLLVNLGGVRGFVPSSQVSSLSGNEASKQSEMSKLQGQALPLKIIEINRSRNRLILSERQAQQEQRESMRSRLLKELEPGQVRPGQVSSICDFGAFVDIGGADGLIHLSELSWKRVSHPSEVLKVGDRINVHVLSVDPNERKIALSLKRTQPEPWSTITENYHLGQVVKGTITQLTSFGAFARLEDGIEGLIHVSELAEGRVAHPRNVVKEGDVIDLKVIRIDPVKKRIGLSLKRMSEDAEGKQEPGEGAQGVVDEETAASTAETPGAYGVVDETSIPSGDEGPGPSGDEGRRTVDEEHSSSVVGPSSPQGRGREGSRRESPRAAQPRSGATPRKPEQKPRGETSRSPEQAKGTPQQQARGAERRDATPREDREEEPMGAMAHAFAKLAQSQQEAGLEQEESERSDAASERSDAAPPEPAKAQMATSEAEAVSAPTKPVEMELGAREAAEPEKVQGSTFQVQSPETNLEPGTLNLELSLEAGEAEATSAPSEESEPEASERSDAAPSEPEESEPELSASMSSLDEVIDQEPAASESSDEDSEDASAATDTDADASSSVEAMPADADAEVLEQGEGEAMSSVGEGDVSDVEADVASTDDEDSEVGTEEDGGATEGATESDINEKSEPLG